jgi:hypothetical protein
LTVNTVSGNTWTPGTGTVILVTNNTLPATIFTNFNNLQVNAGTTTTGAALPTISGSLTVKAGAVFSLAHNVGATAGPTSVDLECGGATGSTVSGAGTLTLGGNVTVTYTGSGTASAVISAPLALGATRTFSVADDGTSATDLLLSNSLGGTGFGVTKDGAGTMVFSASNTYTGLTTITAGTLQYGIANALSNGPVSLNGGGLSTGATTGYGDNLGTLALTENSNIYLGTGNHTLAFTASFGVSWTSGKTLTISGWTGAIGTSGSEGKLFVGGSGTDLLAVQIAQIQFLIGSSYFGAAMLASGEIVPVPSITTGAISTTPFCVSASASATGTAAYTSAGTFSSASFTAWLSDAAGSFTSPTNIGSDVVTGTNPSGTISITIPAGTASGSGYKIRIDCSSPLVTGSLSSAFVITNGISDVSSAAASVSDASTVLTWTNPVNCFDEILIVAQATSSITGTPTGDGTSYGANLAYGSGDAFAGGGFVVYKGTTSPQTVTNMTNGTQYYFKFFARRGSEWSTGAETSATPVPMSFASDYFRSTGSGLWTTAGNWESSHNNADWYTATLAPTSSASAIDIRTGHTVWATSSPSSANLTVNGTYEHRMNGGTIPTATWNAASTCLITGITTTMPGGLGQTFGNVTWNSINQTGGIYFATNLNIGGNFTITDTGTGSVRLSNTSTGYTVSIAGNYAQSAGEFRMNNNTGVCSMTVGGNFSLTGGVCNMVSGAANSSITVAGNVDIATGELRMSEDANIGTLNVTGNFTHTSGTITETNSGSGLIAFKKSGVQIYTSGGTISNRINFNVNSGSTLQMDSPTTTITGGGTFTLSAGATLGVTSSAGITTSGASGNIQVTGTRTYTAGANYIYNGTGGQSSGNGLNQNTPANITFNNPGNTVNLTASTNMSGVLTVNAGSTFGLGSFNIGTTTKPSSVVLECGASAGSVISGSGILNLGGDISVTSAGTGTGGASISAPIALGGNRIFTVADDGTAAMDLTIGGSITGGQNLEKAGSGQLSLGTGTITLGALSISAGSLESTSGALNLTGAFTNDGTFTDNSGTVNLNGSLSQSVGGTSSTTFNNLTLNNTNGASLGNNGTVNGVLTFTNGKISTGANVLILGSAASVSGAGSGKYVYGTLRRDIPSTTDLSEPFDIGDATNYTPVTVLFAGATGGSGYLDVTTAVSAPPAASGISQTKYVNRKWTIVNNGVTFVTCSPTFTFVAGDIQGSATTANFVVRKLDVGTWTAPTNGTRTATSTQATGISSFSEFAIGETGVHHFQLTLATPQYSGVPFTEINTLTAQDILNQTVTTFDASADNVTIAPVSPLTGAITGLSGVDKLTNALDFDLGVANLTTLGMEYGGNTGTGTFTATSVNGITGTSGDVEIKLGEAAKFIITGSATQVAGDGQDLTITATDAGGNTVAGFGGAKSLIFSGANSSSSPATAPTITSNTGAIVPFGDPTSITFTAGVATVHSGANGFMKLYKAETAYIVAAQGTITTTGDDRLTVVVSNAPASNLVMSLGAAQTNAAAFTGTNTITAFDAYGNTAVDFEASDNNVTIAAVAPLTGSISGLSGTNILTSVNDFTSGIANLTTLGMIYTGNAGSGTFTATSATGGMTGTSGSVTIGFGALHHFQFVLESPQKNGVSFTGTTNQLEAQDVSDNIITNFDASADNVTITVATLVGSITGLSGTNKLNGAGDFVSGVATLTGSMKYSGTTGTGKFTATSATGKSGTSGDVLVNAGPATKFIITGNTTQIAGDSQNLTITATDAGGNTDAAYTGDHSLTFSGANATAIPNTPAILDKDGNIVGFGTSTPITFSLGVAIAGSGKNGVMTLYKAEDAVIAATDGTLNTSGTDRLSVTVSHATLDNFVFALNTPQINAVAFTGTNTLTAKDIYGNTFNDFKASENNVTITSTPADGTITGLGLGINAILNQDGDFNLGVADLTTKLVFTGKSVSHTFTATSATGSKTGTSGSVTINAGALDHFHLSLNSPQTNGLAFTGTNTLTAQDISGNTITNFSAATNNVTIAANAPLAGVISGLSEGNKLTGGDFSSGIANLTNLGMIYTGTSVAGTFTATSATGSKTGTSESVTIDPGAATKLVITGTGTQNSGANQSITITAQDASSNTATGYDGDKALTFSGAASSSSPVTVPTVTDKTGAAVNFGTPTTIPFNSGVATGSSGSYGVMALYKAESAVVSATDLTISSTGSNRLTVVVSPGALGKFAFVLSTPQLGGTPFTGTNTLTAQDDYGNTVNFNASTNNVTVTADAPLSGTITGLSNGASILNNAGDFSSGVCNITTQLMIYTGIAGTGTFTATSATGSKTGTSNAVVIIPSEQATDHFRSRASGNWNATGTWERSADGTSWYNAVSLFPTSSAGPFVLPGVL